MMVLSQKDCIEFIKKSESIINNGYCYYFESTSILSDFGTQIPNIPSLYLISYSQIIAPICVELLSKYLNISHQQSYLMFKVYNMKAQIFDLKSLNEIKERNILIINNDKIEVVNFQTN
jgi:hypothetical protein